MKTIRNILIITLPTLFIVLIILEVFFRIVIPASNSPRGFFDDKEKMYFLSNEKEKGLYTIGRFAEIRAKWRINNMNQNYPIDYYPKDNKKLIAVIGDSFIEAFQVNVGENYPFLLREKIKNNYEVYAFGKSGAPISQYLNISRYVNRHFEPDILIINLVSNDFDESIHELYPDIDYFLQVSVNADDSITETIPRPNYSFAQYKPLKRLIYKSALFRYLYTNLKVSEIRQDIIKPKNNAYEANINAENVKNNKDLILSATNYLVKTIREENSDKRIIFVMDAPRESIYNNTLDKSKTSWMNDMMKTMCTNYNIEYIDLTTFMEEDYRNNHIKFNSDLDAHWNEYGHKFVANILYNYLMNNNQ